LITDPDGPGPAAVAGRAAATPERAEPPADVAGSPDPFGVAAIRQRVLAAWAAAPVRFREDANAEEDLVHGAYRDRLLVELAQNAADAAARAGVPGVLRLSLVDGELRAANTGAPLDAAGVEALATLRASAKREPESASVGRFGVGFAAVLAVTDAPALRSVAGGVRFSAADTLAAVRDIPALGDELARRGGQVPVLRLPWPEGGGPPAGYATEVRLPLRPGAEPAVRAALAALDPTLLLALPGLASIVAADRVLSRVDEPGGVVRLTDGPTAQRWLVRSAAGTLPAELLAGRPVEERERPEWTVSWAVPVGPTGAGQPLPARQVLHAPTPSDEPISLPARLIATFPFGPDRRHVAPGPITDRLVERVAAVYAELLTELPATPAALALVPQLGLAAAELDAAVSRAALRALQEASWLPTVPAGGPPRGDGAAPGDGMAPEEAVPADGAVLAGGVVLGDGVAPGGGAAGERVRPLDAVVVDAATESLVESLADVLPGLLPAAWSAPAQRAALNALGVRRLSTSDVVAVVSGVDRPPAWWRRLYDGLAAAPDREALAALPVPLADGRVVTGVRGVLLPAAGLPAGAASALGLRVVHPEAAHPLLERLGAVPATAAGVLADERVRAAVEASYEEEDPQPVAEAVLALVAAAGVDSGELPWLAELALPGADGDWYPAGELLLPGSPLAEVVQPDAPFGRVEAELAARWDARVLRAVGVLDTFAVLRVPDVEVGLGGHDLDGEQDWYDAVADRLPPQPVPPRLVELVAVRDLELVRPDRWPQALALLATLPAATTAAVAVLADGSHVDVPPYTRWWLASHPVLAGSRPDRLRLAGAAELAGLYQPAAGDPGVLGLAGCLRDLADVLVDPERAAELLDRLGDPVRTVPAATLREVYARLAFALDGCDVPPPARVRVAPEQVAGRDAVAVLDAPHLLPLLRQAVVPAGGAPGPVADLLDVPFASELVSAAVTSVAVGRQRWADVPGAPLAAERCAALVPDAEVAEHDPVTVTGGVQVGWWPGGAGAPDAVTRAAGAAALGRAFAWRLGRWDRRAAAVEAFARPADGATLRAEDAADA
jgi:hypothetical protein